jgi:RNA polymerase sigma-70 factor (ECF subfamily)
MNSLTISGCRSLDSFRDGMPETLTRVYQSHVERLRRFISHKRLAGAAAAIEAEDLVQETFIRAFTENARRHYDGSRPFIGYLLGIARNLVIDAGRTRARQNAVAREQVPTTQLDPELELANREAIRLCREIASSLDPLHGTVFMMRFVQGEPRETIAEVTGLTAYEVRRAECRVQRRISKRLAEVELLGSASRA